MMGSPPPWVEVDHDGLVTELRHAWWVKWLVLWVVPLLLVVAVAPWWLRPTLVDLAPYLQGAFTAAAGLITGVAAAVAGLTIALVSWLTAPVVLRLRGPMLTVTRVAPWGSRVRQFDLRHTRIDQDEARASLHLVMQRHYQTPIEDTVSVPFSHRRSEWLFRALRSAVIAASQAEPAEEPSPEARDALERLRRLGSG